MQDSSPEFTFATDGEPSDSSVEALALLLLSLVDLEAKEQDLPFLAEQVNTEEN